MTYTLHKICSRYFQVDADLADRVKSERSANSEKVQA
ncbi:MAG: hypothetical protein ACI80L_001781 [Pseudohongiellaceae bacterium]|jgi:hypothetical protein